MAAEKKVAKKAAPAEKAVAVETASKAPQLTAVRGSSSGTGAHVFGLASSAATARAFMTAVALRGISKKMKVTAAQRVVMSLRAQQCSPVGDHLDG